MTSVCIKPALHRDGAGGRSLRDVSKAPSIERVLWLGTQVAEALEAAHARIASRRETGGIFVTSRGQAKVVDFGLAKIVPDRTRNGGEKREQDRCSRWHLSYMAPEQLLVWGRCHRHPRRSAPLQMSTRLKPYRQKPCLV
jgi:hypothetical protein